MGPHLPDGLRCLPSLVSVSFLVGPALETGRSLRLPELCPSDTGFLGVLHSWLCFNKSILRADHVCSLSDLQISGQLTLGDHLEPLFLLPVARASSSHPPLPSPHPLASFLLLFCPLPLYPTPTSLLQVSGGIVSLLERKVGLPPLWLPPPLLFQGLCSHSLHPPFCCLVISAWSVMYPHTVFIYLFILDMRYFLSLKKSPAKGSRGSLEDTKPKYSWFADSP